MLDAVLLGVLGITRLTGKPDIAAASLHTAATVSAKAELKDAVRRSLPTLAIRVNAEETATDNAAELIREQTETVQQIVEEPVEDTAVPEETGAAYSTLYGNFTQEEMELLWAVVMQEGGPSYEAAQAVMSTVINRLNDPYWAWCGDTVMEQITYPWQYCYSIDTYWQKYLGGNVGDDVKNAVIDVLNGAVSHIYTCFRGYYVDGAVQIGDNWFWYGH